VNAGLAPLGLPPLSVAEIKKLVGEGVGRLIEKVTPPEYSGHRAGIRERMLSHYAANATRYTRPYPGIRPLLDALREAGIPLAVVSNKNEALSRQVLGELRLMPCFAFVMGSDSAPERKPSPVPLLEASARLGLRPGEGLIVGDSEFDIRAGRSAGMPTCAVSWGFRPRELLSSLSPDRIVEKPEEILRWLRPERP